jgi:hypothetical protein
MRKKSHRFQAFIKVSPPGQPGRGGSVALVPGQARRMAILGEHHGTGHRHFFTALVTNEGEGSAWLDAGHEIVTVTIRGEELTEYFSAGNHFALWLGDEIADGVVVGRAVA